MVKRVQTFDILKTISIILVVFCHCSGFNGTITENVLMTICFIGVPIFFMVNGALLLNKPFDLKKHLKKTATVYFVAVIWRLLYLVIGLLQAENIEIFADHTQETLSYLFFWTESSFASPAHMWFMRNLLAIYLIFPLLRLCFNYKEKNIAHFSLAVIFVVFILCVEIDYIILAINKYLNLNIAVRTTNLSAFMPYNKGQSIFYFFLGGVLWNYLKNREEKVFEKVSKFRIFTVLAFLFSWFLMIFTKFLTDGTWSWNGVLYADGYSRIPTLLAVLTLSALLIDIEIKNKNIQKFFETISDSTLGIFYFHWLLLPIIEPFFTQTGIHINLLKTIIIIILSCMLSRGLGYIPFLRKLVQ